MPVLALLTSLDWTVIVLYASGMIAVGLWFARANRNAEDYLLGGRRMKPLAVGLSLFASLLSTISYLGYTGEMIRYGPMYMLGMAAFPLVLLVVGGFMIPTFMQLRVTSAYEILETHLGGSVRLLGSFFFLALRLLWMALIIFATTDTVLVPLMGLPPAWAPALCAIMGLITIAYTSLGGLRAVIITDVAQSAILFIGALLTIVLISQRLGGASAWWPQNWPEHWPAMAWGYDPAERMTFVGITLSVLFWHTCTAGSDQIAIQRYFATRDTAAARRVLAVNLATTAFAMLLMGVVGLALLGFYRSEPAAFAGHLSPTTNADALFPHFIGHGLPAGVSGLVIAGLLAAAMSSLSSGMSAASSVITAEFGRSSSFRKMDDTGKVRLARWISLAVGLLVLLLSLIVNQVEGNLFKVTNKVVNLFVAPLFVLFFMALFVKRSNAPGAWLGAAGAVAVALWIAFWEDVTGEKGVSFLWIMPASFVTGALLGWLGSIAFATFRSRTR